MAEVNIGKNPKIIAFYLPQFHEIPENNEWWGKGFTEWINVKKAQPLFNGHDQPRVPLNGNYYNLLDDRIKIWQADLAKKYGIFGFCYYHYWFKDGKKLLEKPAEQMLNNTEIDIPFCFSWANENWSKNWDGGNREIIMKQEYGGKKDWEKHLQYLLPFFRDKRYITVDGKPLLIIYKPEQIIDIYQMARYFRKRMINEGFTGLCLAFQFPSYYYDMYYRDDIFDYRIGFEPVFSRINDEEMIDLKKRKLVKIARRMLGEGIISVYRKVNINKIGTSWKKSDKLSHYSYNDSWNRIINRDWADDFLPGAFVDWDNTPRNRNGVVYDGFSTDAFKTNIYSLVKRARVEKKPMIFINAWNEWAEGAFLEPDEKYGFGKLDSISSAVMSL